MGVTHYANQQNRVTQLQNTVDYVWNSKESDFYRQFWQRHAITKKPTLKRMEDLATLPILEKADFLQFSKPDDRCYVPIDDVKCLIATSGTTGQPFFKWYDHYHAGPVMRHMYRSGSRRMLYLWRYHGSSPYITALTHGSGIETVLCDPKQLSEAKALAASFKPDQICTTPSIALLAADELDIGVRRDIKFMLLLGEPVTKTTRKLLKIKYPGAMVYDMFGFTEAACQVFYRTPNCDGDGDVFHINTEHLYVEVAADDELVFTTLALPHSLPLIRYKTGDQGTFYSSPCRCGTGSDRVRLVGRSNVDFVRTQGVELHIGDFENLLLPLGNEIEPYLEVNIFEKVAGSRKQAEIHLTVVAKADSKRTPQNIKRTVMTLLRNMPLSNHLKLEQAVKSGLFLKPHVTVKTRPTPALKNRAIRLRV